MSYKNIRVIYGGMGSGKTYKILTKKEEEKAIEKWLAKKYYKPQNLLEMINKSKKERIIQWKKQQKYY